MRLDSAREETITNLNGSQKFRMNASAKAFQILSSGIYERKIEAIVRELSCNAYDSHVIAGKADEPFRIQLPTAFNDFIFAVEDFGVGLSEEEVYNVYTTYFESTKTDSNEVIGALGLGSKTPFSYTDSFTVKARKGGKECVFSAQISASGEPEVVKMYERPWTGCNGVEVSVEVAAKDIQEFYNSASKVLSWFSVKPLCNKEIDYKISSEVVENVRQYGYHLQTNTGFSNNSDYKVIMGNVAYDLELDDIKFSSKSQDLTDFISAIQSTRANLYFEVAIGDADVAASRETLSLDDRTKANLLDKIEVIRKNFYDTTIQKVSSMKNIFEAIYKLTTYEAKTIKDYKINGYALREVPRYIKNSVRIVDSNAPTVEEVQLQCISDSYDISFYIPKTYGYKNRNTRSSDCLVSHCLVNDEVVVVVNDCERKVGIKDAIIDNHSLPRGVMVVSDKKTKVNADLEKLIDHLTFGSYKIIYASTFWDGKLSSKKSSSKGLAEKVVKIQRMKRDSRVFSFDTVDFNNKDLNRWAFCQWNDWFVTVDTTTRGSVTCAPHEVKTLMEELDLDGVVAYNSLNEKKVKRIFDESRNLGTLCLTKASKVDAMKAQRKELFLNEYHKDVYRIFESYEVMYNLFVEDVAGVDICSKVIYGNDLFTPKEEAAFSQSLENRLKVYQDSVDILKSSSPMLKNLLTNYGFDVKVIPEVRLFLKMRKEK